MTGTVTIYTDGACKGNPGPGGWGVLLRMGRHEKELSGGDPHTTNNRMELMASIKALEALKKPRPSARTVVMTVCFMACSTSLQRLADETENAGRTDGGVEAFN